MNIYQIIHNTFAEGPGKRTAIWVQGCHRHCEGCMLPMTWSEDEGHTITPEEIISKVPCDNEGITVLGGEPFEQPEGLKKLLHLARRQGLSTIVFTGNTYESIKTNEIYNEILKYIDVLVDGEYIKELRSFDVPMIGSSNQRFIFLTNRYDMKDIPPNKIEIRIRKDGKPMYSGMGDFDEIKKKLEAEDEI